MADIDFFTFTANKSLPFAEFLRQTGEITKSGEHNVHWKCILSNETEKIPNGFKCVGIGDSKSSCPSMRHAISIEKALEQASNKYVIISDADIALLYKNWDKIIVQILNDYSCFGSPNHSNEHGEQDFPNVPFFAFKKNIMKKIKLNFRPILNEQNAIKRVEAGKEKIMGRGIGEFVFFETGCQLSSGFKKAGLKSKCLKSIQADSKKTILKYRNLKEKICLAQKKKNQPRLYHNKLFEYHYNNEIFATHFGSGSIYNLDIEPAKSWKKRIENYLEEQCP